MKPARFNSAVLAWCVVSLLLAANSFAQDVEDEPPPQAAPPKDPIRFERLGVGYGARQYRPGRWGLVGIDVSNFTDEPTEVLAQVGLGQDATLFHARRIWVPPDSVRRTWTTIRLPMETTTNQRQDIFCQLFNEQNGVASLKTRAAERKQHKNSLRVVSDPLVTGLIVPIDDYETGESTDASYEMVIAARGTASLGRQVALIGNRYLPPVAEAYDVVDQLVLNNDRFAEEPVGCAAIRSWLHDGGQVWLQLDRVKIESAARLLGERFRCEEVDRVDLHEVEIVSLDPRRGVDYTGKRAYEGPVPFVRLAVEDAEVTHEVEGWPAAFIIHYGRGRVVATTVGGAAWVTVGEEPRNLAQQGRFDALPELSELDLVISRGKSPATSKVLGNYLQSHIGYRIVGRSTVVTTLCVFCVFLIVCGVVLAGRGGLEKMMWIAPLGALVAASPLIWMGMRAQQSAPPSVAMAQFVQIGDASRHAHVTGALAMYRPEPGEISIGSDEGGLFEPEWQGLENSLRRMVRSDAAKWRWENIRVTSGVRTANIQQQIVLDNQVEVRGTFDETGFRGGLAGMPPLEDALIAESGRPSMAVDWSGSDFRADAGDQLAKDQYVRGTLLSDEQRRRLEVYSQLFAKSSQDNPFPPRRMLLGWTKPFDIGFQFPDDSTTVGGALVAASLMIDRPSSGSAMRVPPAFIRFKSTTSPSGMGGGSALYSTRTGQWIRSESPTDAWLLCIPPTEILPATISRATVRMKCTIPSRELTIAAADGSNTVELLKKRNPSVPFELVIDKPELLKLDESGGFRLGVRVSETFDQDPDSELGWNIDYLDIELEATAD